MPCKSSCPPLLFLLPPTHMSPTLQCGMTWGLGTHPVLPISMAPHLLFPKQCLSPSVSHLLDSYTSFKSWPNGHFLWVTSFDLPFLEVKGPSLIPLSTTWEFWVSFQFLQVDYVSFSSREQDFILLSLPLTEVQSLVCSRCLSSISWMHARNEWIRSS